MALLRLAVMVLCRSLPAACSPVSENVVADDEGFGGDDPFNAPATSGGDADADVAEDDEGFGFADDGFGGGGGGDEAAAGAFEDAPAAAPGAPAETSIFAVLEREIGVLGSGIGPSGTASGSGAASEGVEEEAAYVAALEGFVFDQAELLSDRAPQRHHYADQAAAAEGGGALPALRKKLMKEVRAPADDR